MLLCCNAKSVVCGIMEVEHTYFPRRAEGAFPQTRPAQTKGRGSLSQTGRVSYLADQSQTVTCTDRGLFPGRQILVARTGTYPTF